MSEPKRWIAVQGPRSYVTMMPVGDNDIGPDIFAKSGEVHALAAQLATARERIRQLETRGNELALAADELYEAISENGDSNNAIDARFDAAMAAWLAGGAKEGA